MGYRDTKNYKNLMGWIDTLKTKVSLVSVSLFRHSNRVAIRSGTELQTSYDFICLHEKRV